MNHKNTFLDIVGEGARHKTAAIPGTLSSVPNYPSKLKIYLNNASPYWQAMYFDQGTTYRHSCKTYNKAEAYERAKMFYEMLILRKYQHPAHLEPHYHYIGLEKQSTERKKLNFEHIANEWLIRKSALWSPRHKVEVQRRLMNNVFPYIRKKNIQRISTNEVLVLLQRIEERRAFDLSHRVLNDLSQIWRYAMASGICKRDVTEGLAVMAFASSAQAGITIPAGDWTVDIGGNVNAYYTNVSQDKTTAAGVKTSSNDANTIGTGLLPAAFGIGAKTRQNDLDIAFQFSFFTGTSSGNNVLGTNGLVVPNTNSGGAAGNNTLNIRQAFLSFGDASWGTIKAGRDLGIFGSDAILSDMTLLGVGNGGPAGGSSTLGRIGSGYIYADWKGQFSYTSPNWNGFSFSAGAIENFKPVGNSTASNDNLGYEGKVAYDFAANDVTGRVWLSGLTQKTKSTTANYTSNGIDIGVKAAYQGFGLVAYY